LPACAAAAAEHSYLSPSVGEAVMYVNMEDHLTYINGKPNEDFQVTLQSRYCSLFVSCTRFGKCHCVVSSQVVVLAQLLLAQLKLQLPDHVPNFVLSASRVGCGEGIQVS
jgi:hypothetical protein